MNKLQKLSKELPFLIQLENLKSEVDAHRPLSRELENKIFQKLRLDWNFNSNAIEGNSFTRGETVSLLMEGITAKGKPLKDAIDIKGHNEAIDFMLSLIKDKRSLTEADIRALHKLVLGKDFFNKAETAEGKPTRKIIKSGQYKTQPNHVKTSTGEIHYYATPEETPSKMKELVDWYNENSQIEHVNPIVLASVFHHKFVEIHPFDDGNGRMTRLLTNFILMKFGYPVSVIKKENRSEYYSALSQADNGEIIPIIEFVSNTVKKSLEIMAKAINGESIAEDDDLDKEIELFRKEIGFKKDYNTVREDIDKFSLLYQIIKYPSDKLAKFSDLFIFKLIRLEQSNIQVGFNINELENLEDFKYRISNTAFATLNMFDYKFIFQNSVHNGKDSHIEKKLNIVFNDETYTITTFGNKLTKYYDEEIYDDGFIDLMKIYLRIYMSEIKKVTK